MTSSADAGEKVMKRAWLATGLVVALGGCAAYGPNFSEEEYRGMETERLCGYHKPNEDRGIIEIIESRDLFTDREMEAIKEQEPKLGIREEALKCAMGYPERTESAEVVSREATDKGMVKKYGFKYTTPNPAEVLYVELTDGKVTKIAGD